MLAGYIKMLRIKNINAAFPQLILGTIDKVKKYKGARKKEKGIRNNFMLAAAIMRPVLFIGVK